MRGMVDIPHLNREIKLKYEFDDGFGSKYPTLSDDKSD